MFLRIDCTEVRLINSSKHREVNRQRKRSRVMHERPFRRIRDEPERSQIKILTQYTRTDP